MLTHIFLMVLWGFGSLREGNVIPYANAIAIDSSFSQLCIFTDDMLNEVVLETSVKNQKLVIYSWSPHMNLSVKGLHEVISQSLIMNFKLIVLLDPNANFQIASQIVSRESWPADFLIIPKSQQLSDLGFRIHYPSYIFVKDGKIESFVPGYKTNDQLDRLIKADL